MIVTLFKKSEMITLLDWYEELRKNILRSFSIMATHLDFDIITPCCVGRLDLWLKTAFRNKAVFFGINHPKSLKIWLYWMAKIRAGSKWKLNNKNLYFLHEAIFLFKRPMVNYAPTINNWYKRIIIFFKALLGTKHNPRYTEPLF